MPFNAEDLVRQAGADLDFLALPATTRLLWWELLSSAVAWRALRVRLPDDASGEAVAVLTSLGWLRSSDAEGYVRVSAPGQGQD